MAFLLTFIVREDGGRSVRGLRRGRSAPQSRLVYHGVYKSLPFRNTAQTDRYLHLAAPFRLSSGNVSSSRHPPYQRTTFSLAFSLRVNFIFSTVSLRKRRIHVLQCLECLPDQPPLPRQYGYPAFRIALISSFVCARSIIHSSQNTHLAGGGIG